MPPYGFSDGVFDGLSGSDRSELLAGFWARRFGLVGRLLLLAIVVDRGVRRAWRAGSERLATGAEFGCLDPMFQTGLEEPEYGLRNEPGKRLAASLIRTLPNVR